MSDPTGATLLAIERETLETVDRALALVGESRADDSGTGREDAAGPRPFRLYRADELAQLPPATWVVADSIPRDALVGLIGEKGSLKTFATLDLAVRIGTGLPWHARSVAAGPVVYIYAEGPFGALSRLKAWCAYHARTTGLPFNLGEMGVRFHPAPVPITNAGAIAQLMREIDAGEAPAVIIVDTLNRCLGEFDEDGRGMSAFVTGCSTLQRRYGCTVLVVHHTPLAGSDRGRGHGAFDGALDTRLIVSRDADKVTIDCTHQRNGKDGWSVTSFALSEGDSLVLVPGSPTAGKLIGQRRALLELLHARATATYSEWHTASELKSSSFKKARTWLLANDYVAQDRGKYIVTAAGVAALGHQGYREATHG